LCCLSAVKAVPASVRRLEDQIQSILDALSNPLVSIVPGTASTGYRMSLTAANGRLCLRILGDRIVRKKA